MIQIKHCYTNAVLFEYEPTQKEQSGGIAMRAALEKAAETGANLAYANLAYANLAYANLAGANLAGANLAYANLTYAHLTGANLTGALLTGANFTGANFTGANLTGAYLTGAKWRGGITINRAPLQLSGLRWMVYILDSHMQIGCELHSLADWATFDDNRIIQMGGKDALRFWRAHKDALLSLAKPDGRE